MRRTVKFLMRHFGLRSCNYDIPSSTGRKYQVCLDYHIGRCAGACEDLESVEEYQKHVDAVIMFLSGRRKDLINKLQERMATASNDLKFEEAARLRDTIEAFESIWQKQKVDSAQDIDRDIIAFARDAADATTVVMQIREGILIGRQDFQLAIDKTELDRELLAGFLKQYYNHAENLPGEIYIPIEIEDTLLFESWLSEMKKSKIRLITPQKGEKVKLIAMAETNARLLLDEILLQKMKYKTRVPKASSELQKFLGLDRAPITISCFDVSNLGETDKAASLAFFDRGKPKKAEYRHFKIKNVEGQDDFASMREVIDRYVSRQIEAEIPLPDLMMVDGGKGQLSVAKEVLNSHGLNDQPVIGLAKRLEEVYIPDQTAPVSIPRHSTAIRLLKLVRDEAHRFAITYHRKLRSRRIIGSELENISGIGENRRNLLLKHFGSMKKIREASYDEIKSVKGMPQSTARRIYDYFHSDQSNRRK
jgi:excinuclease ABC subunit C